MYVLPGGTNEKMLAEEGRQKEWDVKMFWSLGRFNFKQSTIISNASNELESAWGPFDIFNNEIITSVYGPKDLFSIFFHSYFLFYSHFIIIYELCLF